jgi:hypothetical protein
MEKRQPIDDLIDLWVWIGRQLKKKAPKRTRKVGEPDYTGESRGLVAKNIAPCAPIDVHAAQLAANHHKRTNACEAGHEQRDVKQRHTTSTCHMLRHIVCPSGT